MGATLPKIELTFELVEDPDLTHKLGMRTGGATANIHRLAELDMTDNGFYWTKEELADASRVAMDRLFSDSTELDEFLPRSAHMDRMKVRVEAERRKREQAEAEGKLAAYLAKHGAA